MYQCTESWRASGSPITILVDAEESEGEEYAVAASISASWVASSGLVCNSTFNFGDICRCESCRAPERANMRGMKSSVVEEVVEGEDIWVEVRGCVGMRQVKGASL